MSRKKDIVLSVIALLIVAVGAIVLLVMNFPAGLLIVLPSAIPHVLRLYDLKKK